MKIINKLRQNWGILVIFLVWILIVICNYEKGSFLSGWDNLHPEINPLLSIKRSLNVVWQEYQGLGLLGGMGHAADLVRQILIWPLSYILPLSFIRWMWHLGMILLGGMGAYRLVFSIQPRRNGSLFERYSVFSMKKNEEEKEKKVKNETLHCQILSELTDQDDGGKWAAMFGGIFYMINLGTVQNFFVTFEPFACFFGFLPWLILVLMRVLERGEKKDWINFILINFLATPSFYVQTIFVVYMIVITVFSIQYSVFSIKREEKERFRNLYIKQIGMTVKIWLVILIINAFWFLPVVWYTFTNSDVTLTAKGSQMSTIEMSLRNDKYGGLKNIAGLKGFLFNYTDFDKFGNSIYLLDEWKQHLEDRNLYRLSYVFFALIILGAIKLFMEKNRWRWSILLIFLISILMLWGDNPPIGFLARFARSHIPLFGQIFRSAYTKLVIPASLIYSILFGFGVGFILKKISILKKSIGYRFLLMLKKGFLFLVMLLMLWQSWPIFEGKFFYEGIKQEIPKDYFKVFDFFEKQDRSERIADIPAYMYWGWQYNDWKKETDDDYRGSGFWWYGIEQPLLSRTFDVWSKENEQFYWEMQYAWYLSDIELFENVLAKYDVTWLLMDKSLLNRNGGNDFNWGKIEKYLDDSDRIRKEQSFGDINIYKVEINEIKKDYVSLWHDLPIVSNTFSYTWEDEAYSDYGEYVNLNSKLKNQNSKQIVYPFSSLFTNRLQKDLEFKVSEEDDFVILEKENTEDVFGLKTEIENFIDKEKYIFAKLSWEKNAENILNIKIDYLIPEIELGNKLYKSGVNSAMDLSLENCEEDKCFLTINYENKFDINKENSGQVLLYLTRSNVIGIYSGEGVNLYDYEELDLAKIKDEFRYKEIELDSNSKNYIVRIPRVNFDVFNKNILSRYLGNNKENCREELGGIYERVSESGIIKYKAITASSCDHFYLESLWHDQGYLIKITSKNVSSIPFKFGVQNASLGTSIIDTSLSDDKEFYDNIIIIPSVEKFNKGYTLFFDTVSFGREVNENELKNISIWPIPYEFIKNIRLIPEKGVTKRESIDGFEVEKKGIWRYKISYQLSEISNQLEEDDNLVLKLSQAYNDGWLAFSKKENPISRKALLGAGGKWEKLNHVKVNNWANGWSLNRMQNVECRITEDCKQIIYIVFWPQILEFLGFGMLGVLVWIVLKK